jgi:hypothetical protein
MHGIERCRGRRGESVVGFLNLPSPIHLLLVKHQPAKSCRLALKSRIVSWRLEGHFTAVKTRTMMPSLHLNLGQTSDVTFSAIWGYFRPSRYLPLSPVPLSPFMSPVRYLRPHHPRLVNRPFCRRNDYCGMPPGLPPVPSCCSHSIQHKEFEYQRQAHQVGKELAAKLGWVHSRIVFHRRRATP